jgi:hypothetical protein
MRTAWGDASLHPFVSIGFTSERDGARIGPEPSNQEHT